MNDRVGCTTLEGVGRKRIGESLSLCAFMQFSPLTPSNCGHHVRDILSLDERWETIYWN